LIVISFAPGRFKYPASVSEGLDCGSVAADSSSRADPLTKSSPAGPIDQVNRFYSDD
jgi:hypothetical protein